MGLKVTAAGKNRHAIEIHGVIGDIYGGISPDDVRNELEHIPQDDTLDVYIDSEGGSFMDSISIHAALSRRNANGIIESKAYSGGSVIAMACKKITMHIGSWMMAHEAMGTLRDAREDELRQAADRIKGINDQLVAIYSHRWNGSADELRAHLNKELWLRDTDAVSLGMADDVDGVMAVAAYVDPSKFGYRNIPDAVLCSKKEETPPKKRLERQEIVICEMFPEETAIK